MEEIQAGSAADQTIWRMLLKSKIQIAESPLSGEFMSLASHGKMDEDQKSIFTRAQAELLSIPGHAQYFAEKIKLAQNTSARSNMPISEVRSEYNLLRSDSILGVLIYLPSPETVKVLGEFLSDEIDQPPAGKSNHSYDFPSNAVIAARALGELRIVGFTKGINIDQTNMDLSLPRQWYQGVKDGNRTFRFEGDPTEYDLNGPASKEKIQRIERDHKRDEEREAGHRKFPPAAVVAKPLSIAGIIAACALCAAALWYFLRGRKVV